VPTTGIVIPGAPRVPCRVTVRSSGCVGGFGGWPSLKITAALAPAAWALAALIANEHVPRCISATLPAVNPVKSAASQPLDEVFGGLLPIGTTTSTACSGPLTSALPE
jgi:hypothetical protein